MAVTVAFRGLEQLKGPFVGSPVAKPAHLYRFVINASGTYATGGFQFDVCNYFTNNRMGASAIKVLWARAFGDYYDGTNTLTADNASISLSSGGTVTAISSASTNNLVTVKLYTGAANGLAGGSELANATAVGGDLGLVALVEVTEGTLGVS